MSKEIPRKKLEPQPASAPGRVWWRVLLDEPEAALLTVPMLFRPWLDGITYPTDNFYFVWWAAILFAIWAVRLLMRGERIRFGVPMAILAGFWVVAALTGFGTTQFDSTYRALILWASYFFLFALATNALRSRAAIGIVLGGFVVSSLAETLWSLVHFKYVLPLVRESILQNPRLLKIYFGSSEARPELIHRLNVNRAFGTLLFPNALAAFLVLGIPYALGESVRSIRSLGKRLRALRLKEERVRKASPLAVLIASLLSWLLVMGITYFLFTFVASFEMPVAQGLERLGPFVVSSSGYQMAENAYVFPWFLFVALLPLAVACGVGFVLQRYGVDIFSLALRVWVMPPLFLLQIVALWLTYSRGGLLALVLGSGLTVAWLGYGSKRLLPSARVAATALLALASMMVLAHVSFAGATPPTPPESIASPPVDQAPKQADTQPGQPASTPSAALVPAARAEIQGAQSAAASAAIRREGVDLTIPDLMNPASFKLRLTYWRTGIGMALHNFWTGVGLGNFGTVYPNYQKLGAGDVKAAHNDYLQALCETGVVGFILFCAFWAYFVIWGALRLVSMPNSNDKWVLGGLYAGLLTFLIHSFVDFNFFNPSLAFFAFLLTGLFYNFSALARDSTQAHPTPSQEAPKVFRRRQLLALPMLIVVALTCGMGFRVYLCDYIIGGRQLFNVGNELRINQVYDAGEYFLQEPGVIFSRHPAKDIETIMALVPNRSLLESFGSIRVRTPGLSPGHRALRLDEPVSEDCFYILQKPWVARKDIQPSVKLWLQEVTLADSLYPHNPETAGYVTGWYEMLATRLNNPEWKQEYTVEYLKWAEETVRRSPRESIYREWLAKALWLRGNLEKTEARASYFERGLEEYRRAAELFPAVSRGWRKYGEALVKYGEALKTMGAKEKEAGRNDRGNALIAEGDKRIASGKEYLQKADDIDAMPKA